MTCAYSSHVVHGEMHSSFRSQPPRLRTGLVSHKHLTGFLLAAGVVFFLLPDFLEQQLDLLMDKSFGDLQFLSDEFSKLEVVVAPAVPEGGESPLSSSY